MLTRGQEQKVSHILGINGNGKYKAYTLRSQPEQSLSCGYFCLWFVDHRCRGVSYEECMNKLSKQDLELNEKQVVDYVTSHMQNQCNVRQGIIGLNTQGKFLISSLMVGCKQDQHLDEIQVVFSEIAHHDLIRGERSSHRSHACQVVQDGAMGHIKSQIVSGMSKDMYKVFRV